MRTAVAIALVGGVLACSSMSPEHVVSVQTLKQAYIAGDSVRVSLTNLTASSSISYNACRGSLEHRAGSAWQVVAAASGATPCLDNLLPLPAGSIATMQYRLPSNLAPGTYRYRLDSILLEGNDLVVGTDRVSNEFVVS